MRNIKAPIRVLIIFFALVVFQNEVISVLGLIPKKTVLARSQENKEGLPSMLVHYDSKGNNVFVECIVTGVTFREQDHSNRKVGKMIVWVDGKKNKVVSTAAFIIKDLPAGNHKLKLEVVDANDKPFGISKEFMVNIPNN